MSFVARIAASFVCTMFGVVFWATLPVLSAVVHQSPWSLRSWLDLTLFYFVVALPGWLIALPFVTYFKQVAGSRPWIMLAIGSGIGPLFMTTWIALKGGWFTWKSDGSAVTLSFWIGFVTTASYVVLLLLAERRRRPRELRLKQISSDA